MIGEIATAVGIYLGKKIVEKGFRFLFDDSGSVRQAIGISALAEYDSWGPDVPESTYRPQLSIDGRFFISEALDDWIEGDERVFIFAFEEDSAQLQPLYLFEADPEGYYINVLPGVYSIYGLVFEPGPVDLLNAAIIGFGYPYLGSEEDPNPLEITGSGTLDMILFHRKEVEDLPYSLRDEADTAYYLCDLNGEEIERLAGLLYELAEFDLAVIEELDYESPMEAEEAVDHMEAFISRSEEILDLLMWEAPIPEDLLASVIDDLVDLVELANLLSEAGYADSYRLMCQTEGMIKSIIDASYEIV